MPRWATTSFTLSGLTVIALVVLTQCRDRFPFAPVDTCFPCACSQGRQHRVLESCALVEEVGVFQHVNLDSKGISTIGEGLDKEW